MLQATTHNSLSTQSLVLFSFVIVLFCPFDFFLLYLYNFFCRLANPLTFHPPPLPSLSVARLFPFVLSFIPSLEAFLLGFLFSLGVFLFFSHWIEAVTFSHHHHHVGSRLIPFFPHFFFHGLLLLAASFAIFIVLGTHNFILAHFWVVYFYGSIPKVPFTSVCVCVCVGFICYLQTHTHLSTRKKRELTQSQELCARVLSDINLKNPVALMFLEFDL